MYLETLQRSAKDRTVRVLLMGAGEYGLSFLAQSCRTPGLVVSAVYARREERGVAAFRHAGLPEDTIRICGNLATAQAALAAGKVVVSNDALMLMQLPLDIVVESTGAPEAAAVHADAALRKASMSPWCRRSPTLSLGRSSTARPKRRDSSTRRWTGTSPVC